MTVKKYFVKIDRIRYPKDPIMTNYPENDYLNEQRDLNLFYKEYIGEHILSPIITYEKMRYYPIQVIDLRFHVDYVTPKIGLFEEYEEYPFDTNLYVTSIKHRENKCFLNDINLQESSFLIDDT